MKLTRPPRLTGLALLGALLAGCTAKKAEPLDRTYPVQGKVVLTGGQPYTGGGSIQFAPIDENDQTLTNASIGPDGSFTLGTVQGNQRTPGARPGTYKVTITPSQPDQSITEFVLPKEYKIEERETTLTIEFDPKKR
jgi:hypothetical protein